MKTFLNLWFHLFEQVYVQPQVVISIHITEPLIVLITVTNAVSIYILILFFQISGFLITTRNRTQEISQMNWSFYTEW